MAPALSNANDDQKVVPSTEARARGATKLGNAPSNEKPQITSADIMKLEKEYGAHKWVDNFIRGLWFSIVMSCDHFIHACFHGCLHNYGLTRRGKARRTDSEEKIPLVFQFCLHVSFGCRRNPRVDDGVHYLPTFGEQIAKRDEETQSWQYIDGTNIFDSSFYIFVVLTLMRCFCH